MGLFTYEFDIQKLINSKNRKKVQRSCKISTTSGGLNFSYSRKTYIGDVIELYIVYRI